MSSNYEIIPTSSDGNVEDLSSVLPGLPRTPEQQPYSYVSEDVSQLEYYIDLRNAILIDRRSVWANTKYVVEWLRNP